MAPIDEHLYDSTPEPQGTTGVAAPPRPTEAPPLNVARMRQLLSEQSRHMADAIDPLQKNWISSSMSSTKRCGRNWSNR